MAGHTSYHPHGNPGSMLDTTPNEGTLVKDLKPGGGRAKRGARAALRGRMRGRKRMALKGKRKR